MYEGTLNEAKMDLWPKRAYQSWRAQQTRSKRRTGSREVGYGAREFIAWWLEEMKKRDSWVCPTVGRIDHSKGYSFDNIRLEERSENVRERNDRLGVPMREKPVRAYTLLGGNFWFRSKLAAAEHFGLCPKTVYNHCEKRTTNFNKFGPVASRMGVYFEWA